MTKLLSLFLFILLWNGVMSCSATKSNQNAPIMGATVYEDLYQTEDISENLVSLIKPKWFETVSRFRLSNSQNEILPHRFWDVDPAINIESRLLNAVITTPESGEYGYDLDLLSGQIYVNRKFCKQNDLTKKFAGVISAPSFSIGFVPRVLDQLNLPQKVIVFGGKEQINRFYKSSFFKVKVVGAFIEQICPRGTCLNSDQWLSRLVLVAVQVQDAKYKTVNFLPDLKKKIDWNYLQAFIENSYGSNKVSEKNYPGYRLGAEISAGQAMNFMKMKSTIFDIKTMGQMRKSCYKLYDYLWKDMKNHHNFNQKFVKNFKKYHGQYKTCSRYIYPSSINESPERFWFFAYLSAFHKLHDLGYAFDCYKNKWIMNPFVSKGKRSIDYSAELRGCSAKDIDVSMKYSVKVLENLRQKHVASYRFIDYDKGEAGTHYKLYAWVPTDAKFYNCRSQKDNELILNKLSFPKEIRWSRNASQSDNGKELGEIIY